MNQELIYEISGKRYILIEIPIVEGHTEEPKRLIKKYGMLYQGVKEINRGGWFGKTVSVQTFFIREDNYIQFAEEMNE